MKEIASTASFMRFRVDQKIFPSWAGPTPSKSPATIAAKKQPVPVAESQLKSYRAASGVSLVTTGAARLIALCRNGTSHTGVVARFIAPLTAGRPHTSTKTERMANGIQALMIWPAVCRRTPGAAVVAARSCSSLQMRFGCQNRRKITVATREMTPPAMSTRFESTWLDHKYCVTLNETPTTRIAGSTSNVSAQPTIARTSQNGTMTPVMGRMRPIDRKSTRLNSSHVSISYAVFCLKKKKIKNEIILYHKIKILLNQSSP